MTKTQVILYLRYLQSDINTLVRTNQDKKKLCELREKRDFILSNGVAVAVKSKPEIRNMEVSKWF